MQGFPWFVSDDEGEKVKSDSREEQGVDVG